MGKSPAAKDRNNKRINKKRKLGLNLKKKKSPQAPPEQQQQQKKTKKKKNSLQDHDPILFGGDATGGASSDDEVATPDGIRRLLEPYSKDQLVNFLLDAIAEDKDLLAFVLAVADRDVSHRKLFVYGLGWDTTRETLIEAFKPYGSIEDCNAVVDKATGRAKGYGFVLFRTRAGAVKALKQPQKKINNRMTSCQLAAIGPVSGSGSGVAEATGRKVYISNVHADAAPDKLKTFFAQFGEIESGPFGYDMLTGKSRGFAIFVYKTLEGAKRALEEPCKIFEGRQLHCQVANESSQKGKSTAFSSNAPATAALLGSAPQSTLAAVAVAQNLWYSQNPAYAALLVQNPLLAAAAVNPALAAAALNPTAGLLAAQGQTLTQGVGSGASGLLGAYEPQGFPGLQGLLGAYEPQGFPGLQGLQSYQDSQLGQLSSENPGAYYGGFSSLV